MMSFNLENSWKIQLIVKIYSSFDCELERQEGKQNRKQGLVLLGITAGSFWIKPWGLWGCTSHNLMKGGHNSDEVDKAGLYLV